MLFTPVTGYAAPLGVYPLAFAARAYESSVLSIRSRMSSRTASDGAEETVSNGAMYLTSSDYEIMHDGAEQVVGIVFPSVDIVPGGTIMSAYILFDVDEVRPGQSDADTMASIYGEANVMPGRPVQHGL